MIINTGESKDRYKVKRNKGEGELCDGTYVQEVLQGRRMAWMVDWTRAWSKTLETQEGDIGTKWTK